ncbi:MAG: hypothetical protein DMG57_00380 [Acidobacteria bacterium]|nr:MAG: hypothetical protein DMG57_00380 [Acidobacteriota bacterium]
MAVVAVGNFAIAFSAAFWQLLFWNYLLALGPGHVLWPAPGTFPRPLPARGGMWRKGFTEGPFCWVRGL